MVIGVLCGIALGAVLVGGGYMLAEATRDAQPIATNEPESMLTPTLVADEGSATLPWAFDESDLEPVVAVAKALAPSVVRIEAGRGLVGSGIVWDAENGYIITNDHVLSSSQPFVRFGNGREVEASIVGRDSARDVAVLQIKDRADLVPATFAGIDTVEVGQLAVAVGHPFGLDLSVTAGVVSVVNWVNRTGGSDNRANPVPVRMIQTDAPINPGNSGGALADRQGRVIGMNTSIFAGTSRDNAGVGFAVPSETVLLIAQRIVNNESLELGYLGLQGSTLFDGTSGALVDEVVAGTPADRGGIKAGDLIVSINDREITSMEELAADIKMYRPGERINVGVIRDGKPLRLAIQVGRYSA